MLLLRDVATFPVQPRERRIAKRLLVLDWLLEFRVSTYALLAALLGSTPHKSSRFFRSLRTDQVIRELTTFESGGLVVMLTRRGLDYLEAYGDSNIVTRVPEAVLSPARIGSLKLVQHELGLQGVLLKRRARYQRLITGVHLPVDPKALRCRPDAVVSPVTNPDAQIAVEYERTRKSTKDIFRLFTAHAAMIDTQTWHAVTFCFERDQHRAAYQRLFDQETCLEYDDGKRGRLVATGRKVTPDEELRMRFRFLHVPVRTWPATGDATGA